jgi:hypothetical protein
MQAATRILAAQNQKKCGDLPVGDLGSRHPSPTSTAPAKWRLRLVDRERILLGAQNSSHAAELERECGPSGGGFPRPSNARITASLNDGSTC